ncbi:MAG: hypothetical protein JO314_06375 [Acidobacteria bacterium]|nr:hypothetical protein [Acidobacteriota bacterium]
MRKKLAVLVLLVSSFLVFLPSMSSGTQAQIRVTFGQRHRHHDRGLHRGWYNGRRMDYYNYNVNRSGYTRQVYYVNGVRYVRWVRTY